MLPRGLGPFLRGIALVARVVELLARDGVGGDQLLHALEEGFGVDGVGLCGGKVGLRLIEFFFARAVFGFFKRGRLRLGVGLGLLDLFGTIAAHQPSQIGLRLCRLLPQPERARPSARRTQSGRAAIPP